MQKIKNIKSKIIVTIVVLLFIVVFYITNRTCPFLRLFNMPCPGCGLTRAWIAAFRLDFKQAFSYHFMFWSVPLLYCCFLCDGKLFKKQLYNIIFYTFLLILFLINWLF